MRCGPASKSAVFIVARTLESETQAPIALRELKGDSFLGTARRYFDALLPVQLEEDEARYGRLADLCRVRNALAHANGLKEGMSPARWRELEQAVARNGLELDDSRGMLVLTQTYIRNAYDDVNACLVSLVSRAQATSRRS